MCLYVNDAALCDTARSGCQRREPSGSARHLQPYMPAECCASAGVCHIHGNAGDDSGVSALLRDPAQPAAAAGHRDGQHLPCPVLCQPCSAPGDRQGAAAAQVSVACRQPCDRASPMVSCTWGFERDSSFQAVAWGRTQTQLTQSSQATVPKIRSAHRAVQSAGQRASGA